MRALSAAVVAIAVGALACDKIPGLSKKGDGGAEGGVATTGGGVTGGALSFLGSSFEGEITMSVQGRGGTGGPRTMVFGIKSPKVRIDATGGAEGNPALAEGATIIADPPAKKAYMLVPKTKTAMLIDFEKAKAARANKPGSTAVLNEVPKIEKTGKKAVIAGYECEEWKVSGTRSRADMCVADGIKWVDLSDLGMASPEVGLAIAAGDANRFPLRVVAFDEKNVETTRMEATKIEKKTLDAASFVVPPDYKVMDMSALMGGIPGLPGGNVPGAPPGLPPGFTPPKTR